MLFPSLRLELHAFFSSFEYSVHIHTFFFLSAGVIKVWAGNEVPCCVGRVGEVKVGSVWAGCG